MFFALNEDQQALQSALRGFLEERCPQHTLVQRIEKRGVDGDDLDVFQRLCKDLDVLGAAVPEDRGGSGAGLVELFVVFQELGRVLYGGPFRSSVLAAEVLVHADPAGNKDSVLTSLIRGDSRGAVAGLSWEADAELRAFEQGRGWRVSGIADFVFDGAEASTVILFAETADGLGVFMVDDLASVVRAPIEQIDLSRSAAKMEFDRVAVRRIGTSASASLAHARVCNVAALCCAAEQIGVAERALEIAVEHAATRKQFGSPIGSFQAVKHRCADAAVAVEAAASIGLHAAWTLDGAREPDRPSASFAKSVCVEASVRVTASAIQVLGGLGYTWEHPIHLYYRRAMASRQSFGSTRTHREIIASRIFGNG